MDSVALAGSNQAAPASNAPRIREAPWLPPAWFFRGLVLSMVGGYWIGCNWWLLRWFGLAHFGGLLLILSFNFLIFMTVWSYYSASYMDPGSPPKEWVCILHFSPLYLFERPRIFVKGQFYDAQYVKFVPREHSKGPEASPVFLRLFAKNRLRAAAVL
jgi:hypothetical protein